MIESEDLENWCEYLQSAKVASLISWQVRSAQDLSSFANGEDWRNAEHQFKFAISERASGKFVGSIGFHSIAHTHRTAEVAYDLSPAYWGRGIMTSACLALCDWGHAHIKLNRIQATVVDTNQASLRVLDRNGFHKEGLLRNFRTLHGQTRDYWMLSKLPTPHVR